MESRSAIKAEDVDSPVLRVGVGGLLLFHGVHKLLHGLDFIRDTLTANGLPPLMAYGVLVGEVVAPVLVLVGLFPRPAAAVIALTMLTAGGLALRGQVFSLTPVGAWA